IEKATRKDFPDGIPAFGTDALRFTFAALATTGRDINFDLGRIEGYRNFCNKLWNAARYVLMNTEGHDCGAEDGPIELSVADRWVVSRLQQVTRQITDAIGAYRFDHVAQTLYSFVWDEYCDWYLELSKPALADPQGSEAARRGTRRTLVQVLEALLRLAHPVMPFITEEIWQRVAPLAGRPGATIMLAPYPSVDESSLDPDAEMEMKWVMEFVLGVRRIRSGMNIEPRRPLPVLLDHASDVDLERLAANRHYIEALARVQSMEVLAPGAEAPESATALVGEMKVLIPMAGLIDKAAETARLDKEIERLERDIQRAEGKLANPNFVDKAPAAVVDKERTRLAEQRTALGQLRDQLERIRRL
ncbi:MAG TPA: valine--tRNA ligase, partial [Alphaproteobacteria bacterium]|nr:valine--tRNA ligase [Alphaproteobacteria bacterium]